MCTRWNWNKRVIPRVSLFIENPKLKEKKNIAKQWKKSSYLKFEGTKNLLI